MRLFYYSLFILLCAPLIALSPFWQGGEKGTVARVIDGDSFVLNSGIVVRMAQIEAPRIRSNDNAGIAARAALNSLISGKDVELKYGGMRRDRSGRALAQVFISNGILNEPVWVNIEMLKAGHARVHTYSDNRARIEDFWLAEREARRAGRGIWANNAYQVRFATSEALIGAEGSFQLIEGRVIAVEQSASLIKLYFGADKTSDVTALIPLRAWTLWNGGISSILALEGRDIRIRGRINPAKNAREARSKSRNYPAHGPQIWLDHPEQIEFILKQ